MIILFAQYLRETVRNHREVGICQRREDQRDEACPPARQGSCGSIRYIAEIGDRLFTRSRVAGSTRSGSLRTRVTVMRETPASRATSRIVGRCGPRAFLALPVSLLMAAECPSC